jgi:hypothetical protein
MEDHNSRPAREIVLRYLISNITRVKWTGGVTEAVECLLCKHEVLSSKPQSYKKKSKI